MMRTRPSHKRGSVEPIPHRRTFITLGILRRLITWNQPVIVKAYSGAGSLALNAMFMRHWGYEQTGPAQVGPGRRLTVTWTKANPTQTTTAR